jgi:hypothetical protein
MNVLHVASYSPGGCLVGAVPPVMHAVFFSGPALTRDLRRAAALQATVLGWLVWVLLNGFADCGDTQVAVRVERRYDDVRLADVYAS